MVRQAHHDTNALKTLELILSLTKDEATIPCLLSSLL